MFCSSILTSFTVILLIFCCYFCSPSFSTVVFLKAMDALIVSAQAIPTSSPHEIQQSKDSVSWLSWKHPDSSSENGTPYTSPYRYLQFIYSKVFLHVLIRAHSLFFKLSFELLSLVDYTAVSLFITV